MDSVIRAIITYLILFALFRISGKRSLGESSPFDLVLLLIISETTQEVLVDGDYSAINMVILVTTLILMDILFSLVKSRFDVAARVIDGVPVLLMEDGRLDDKKLKMTRVRESDILEAARQLHGLESLGDVKHAVLEVNGSISIIPRK